MIVQRLQSNGYNSTVCQRPAKKNVNFGALLESSTELSLRPSLDGISRPRYDCRMNNLGNWGHKASVIKYVPIEGKNEGRFVLTNSKLGEAEVPISKVTDEKCKLLTFLDEVTENKIQLAEKAIENFNIIYNAVIKEAAYCDAAGDIGKAHRVLHSLDSICMKPITGE